MKLIRHTASELQIAILRLFVNAQIRHPNMLMGKLDRTHVKAAMDKGISAQQVSYMWHSPV